jgi:hypothetical protein
MLKDRGKGIVFACAPTRDLHMVAAHLRRRLDSA